MVHTPVHQRRQLLIDATLRVVAEHGLGQLTIRSIVAEANMSLASFHYAFASRGELIDELISTMVQREPAAVTTEVAPNSSIREVIETGLLGYFEHLRSHPEHEQALLELTQNALRSPSRRELARGLYARYTDIAVSSLVHAAEHTGTRWTSPLETIARIMLSLTDGFTLRWLVDRDDGAARDAVVEAARMMAQLAEPV